MKAAFIIPAIAFACALLNGCADAPPDALAAYDTEHLSRGERYRYYSENQEGWYTRQRPYVVREEYYGTYGEPYPSRNYQGGYQGGYYTRPPHKTTQKQVRKQPVHQSGGAIVDTPQ